MALVSIKIKDGFNGVAIAKTNVEGLEEDFNIYAGQEIEIEQEQADLLFASVHGDVLCIGTAKRGSKKAKEADQADLNAQGLDGADVLDNQA